MKQFKVIDQLCLVDGKLMCKKPSNRSYQKAHYKQGDLDGACGAYSIAMALNILGVFEADELYSDKHLDGRTAEWKLIKALNEKGLYRDGLKTEEVQRIINDNYKKYAHAVCARKPEHNVIDSIKNWLDKNIPTIVGLDFSDGGHWVVAVGFSTDDNGEMTHIMTLDPGTDSPTSSYWNGIIDLNRQPRKKYGYHYSSHQCYYVDIPEAVAISLN